MDIQQEVDLITRAHLYRIALVARYEVALHSGDMETVLHVHDLAESDPTLLDMIEEVLIRQTDDMPPYDVQDALSRILRMIERERNT